MLNFNQLPPSILQSGILDQHYLEQLCTIDDIPLIDPVYNDERLKNIIQYYSINPEEMEKELHQYAKELLDDGKIDEAWQILLTAL
ncbi:MAG: hypothetical protein V4556_05710 [Bacteroidota bacterium]